RLCTACRQPLVADAAVVALLGHAPDQPTLYRAAGCAQCSHSGYSGRLAIHEALEVDGRVRQLIGAGADEDALGAAGFAHGDRLGEAARQAVLRGDTTLEEAMRVTRQE